jgi:hypothetical protein
LIGRIGTQPVSEYTARRTCTYDDEIRHEANLNSDHCEVMPVVALLARRRCLFGRFAHPSGARFAGSGNLFLTRSPGLRPGAILFRRSAARWRLIPTVSPGDLQGGVPIYASLSLRLLNQFRFPNERPEDRGEAGVVANGMLVTPRDRCTARTT